MPSGTSLAQGWPGARRLDHALRLDEVLHWDVLDSPFTDQSSLAGEYALLAAQAVYLFAPVLVSAALAGLVLRNDWLHALDRPIDGGRHWRGRRIFGDGKTWRGAVLSIAGSGLVVPLQRALQGHLPRALQAVDYSTISPVAFGVTLGLGAILGELPNSFIKRRLGIPRGGTAKGVLAVVFYTWDQLDTLLGAWPVLFLWFSPSASLVAMSFLIALGLHPLVAWIGYRIGARRSAR
jgi:hypothetical protein